MCCRYYCNSSRWSRRRLVRCYRSIQNRQLGNLGLTGRACASLYCVASNSKRVNNICSLFCYGFNSLSFYSCTPKYWLERRAYDESSSLTRLIDPTPGTSSDSSTFGQTPRIFNERTILESGREQSNSRATSLNTTSSGRVMKP